MHRRWTDAMRPDDPPYYGDSLALDVAEPLPNVTVVTAHGDVDLDTVQRFAECLSEQLRPGHRLVVDLADVSLCGSVCVGTLFKSAELAREIGAEVCYVVPPRHLVHRVLDMVGLLGRLPVARDLKGALLPGQQDVPPDALPEGGSAQQLRQTETDRPCQPGG